MGALERQRGVSFEREVVNQFKKFSSFTEAKRHLEFQVQEAEEGRDLDNTGPLAVQCKRGRKYAPLSALNEVKRTKDNIPLLVTRADKLPAIVALHLDDFFRLLELAFPPKIESDRSFLE